MSRLPDLGPRGEGWLVFQFALLPAVTLAGLVGGPAWSGIAATISSVGGLVLMAGGVLLGGRALLDLGRDLTPLPRPRDGARLVDSGVYTHARHPIYGGLILTAFGWSLIWASPLALALSVVLGLFLWLKSLREEAWLREHFTDYEAYAARTRRFVPYVL